MIALYILLFLVLLVTLMCFVKLRFVATYTDSLVLKLRVLFLTFDLVPLKKKDEAKKRKKKIPKKKKDAQSDKAEKKEKTSYLKKLSDKKGVSGLVSMLSQVAKLAVGTLKGIFKNIVIEKLDISISVVGEDAADTALKYGRLCGVFYSAVAVICDNVKSYAQYNLSVTPDFDDEASMKVSADAVFYVRVVYVLRYGLGALIKLLMIRYKR